MVKTKPVGPIKNRLCRWRRILAILSPLCLNVPMALHATEYIACPDDFVAYLEAAFEDSQRPIDAIFFKVISRAAPHEWTIGNLVEPNSISLSPHEGRPKVEIVFFSEATEPQNYFLVKAAKRSGGGDFKQIVEIGYGRELSTLLASEFGKRLMTPPFNRAEAAAEVSTDTYQRVHLSPLPAGAQLVSQSRPIFDKWGGWHLTLDSGASTFGNVSTRNHFAFTAEHVPADGKQVHVLAAQLQRYSGVGSACVSTEQTIYPQHDALGVEFLRLFEESEPIAIRFEFTR